MMRITVSSVNTPVAESRSYAEYRFFTSIAPFEPRVRRVDVTVKRDSSADRPFLCTVVVDLGASGRLKTQARAGHLSAAIDRAADRIAWLLGHRLEEDFSLKSPRFSS